MNEVVIGQPLSYNTWAAFQQKWWSSWSSSSSAISDSSISKSNTWEFPTIRSFVIDFGITQISFCKPHRRSTWRPICQDWIMNIYIWPGCNIKYIINLNSISIWSLGKRNNRRTCAYGICSTLNCVELQRNEYCSLSMTQRRSRTDEQYRNIQKGEISWVPGLEFFQAFQKSWSQLDCPPTTQCLTASMQQQLHSSPCKLDGAHADSAWDVAQPATMRTTQRYHCK